MDGGRKMSAVTGHESRTYYDRFVSGFMLICSQGTMFVITSLISGYEDIFSSCQA